MGYEDLEDGWRGGLPYCVGVLFSRLVQLLDGRRWILLLLYSSDL